MTMGQWKHQEIFREHIERFGVKVELGCSLAGFEEIEGGVKVKIAKEVPNGKEDEEAIFEYVIGADGARSE